MKERQHIRQTDDDECSPAQAEKLPGLVVIQHASRSLNRLSRHGRKQLLRVAVSDVQSQKIICIAQTIRHDAHDMQREIGCLLNEKIEPLALDGQ